MIGIWTVFKKELTEAWRDRSALLLVMLSAIATGPLILSIMSFMFADMEKRAETREILVQGAQHAPSLRNYLERQSYVLIPAQPGYEASLKSGHLREPVLVIEESFEIALKAGEQPRVTIVTASGNPQVGMLTQRAIALIDGFNKEHGQLKLIAQGVAASHLPSIEIVQTDLAEPASSSASIMLFIPMLLLSTMMYGCMAIALDSTAGERERNSLEPLLCNPLALHQLITGKWLAVSFMGIIACTLGSWGFLPGQWLLRSDALSALFRFSWLEASSLIAIMLPLICAISAVMMSIGIRSKSQKQAQAHTSIFMAAFSLIPMFTVINNQGERPWHLFPPVIAQFTLMSRVIREEVVQGTDLLQASASCGAIAALCLWWIGRNLRWMASR